MYEWLDDACVDDRRHVVTGNRRLARTLVAEYGHRQHRAGRVAWRSPAIYAWRDWLLRLFELGRIHDGGIRINAQQSRVIWEDCVRAEIDDPFVSINRLARQCRDTWMRLHEWMLPLEVCQAASNGQDQRMFARAAARYQRTLNERGWHDEALLPAKIIERLIAGEIDVPSQISLAGFDRISPAVEALLIALEDCGSRRRMIPLNPAGSSKLVSFDNSAAEFRAAGRWARSQLDEDPDRRIAVVVTRLEQSAEFAKNCLREGFVPGWQYSPDTEAAVNVSYGRALSEYPAVHAALLALRWLHQGLSGEDLSLLLRSPFLGRAFAPGRSRIELKLRERPDRPWSRQRFHLAFQHGDNSVDAEDWFSRWSQVEEIIGDRRARQRPSAWAELLDTVLKTLNWPGEGALSSTDFQLDNRWREMLNEFSRLELVAPTLTGREAVSRLATMAGDTIFQSETAKPALAVMGPLEATGQEFDSIWVTGLSAVDWPPQSRPSALLSNELQRANAMPDATPDDTADYARRVLARLRASAAECVLSFPRAIEDAEQLPTALLADLETGNGTEDPGWHAASISGSTTLLQVADSVPPVTGDERVSGGSATLQRQITEPFSAFAYGRLGIRWLPSFVAGIPASLRGSLLHDALFRLYEEIPNSKTLATWTDDELNRKIRRSIVAAFTVHERFADDVLRKLFRLERGRTARLLRAVVNVDRARPGFTIESVEGDANATIGELRLRLRHDRIDENENGELVLLDYKTGAGKKFLTHGEPVDYQLVVYACVLAQPIGGLGLFNVDSKHTGIDGVGPALVATNEGTDEEIDNWQDTLDEWKAVVLGAAEQIAKGDVRLNPERAPKNARSLNLLSRFSELRLDD